ncbi:MAG: hypothetical protein IKP65_04905 [Alphaproteobacteria bacterium]|nr:hypothetical protein [Alphaproteobacteria bacterium]
MQSAGSYYAKTKNLLNNNYPANRTNAYNAKSKQTCNFGQLDPKESVCVRIFWCIASNSDGSAWIQCTKGAKCFSAELSGVYYVFTS